MSATLASVVAEARESTSGIISAVREYAGTLAETTAAGDGVLLKIATDCQAAHRELDSIAAKIAESGEEDTLRKADIVFPALSRAMLLLSGAAMAAADFDEAYSLQEKVTGVMVVAHRRATSAITDAQTMLARASAAIATTASGTVERSGAAQVVSTARAAVEAARQRVQDLLESSPEGSVVGSVRSGLELAHTQLSEVVAAWDTGSESSLGNAATAALSKASEAISTLAGAGAATASEIGTASIATARQQADVAVQLAMTRVRLVRDRMEPAVSEASALGAEGVDRLSSAAAVLATAAEDVVVEATAAADSATGCSDRVRGVWDSLHLSPVVAQASESIHAAADSQAAKAALAKAAEVDGSLCCGCFTRVTVLVASLAGTALDYTLHLAHRIHSTRSVLEADSAEASHTEEKRSAGGKPAKRSESPVIATPIEPSSSADTGSKPRTGKRAKAARAKAARSKH